MDESNNKESNQSPGDRELSSRIRQIFPDDSVAEKIVRLTTTERPFGWGKKSTATYYNRRCGERMREVIDKMLTSQEAILYPYETFCSNGMSKDTLYNLVNQSILYVRERLDTPDHKYENWYGSVEVSRSKEKKGVYIYFKANSFPLASDGSELLPRMVIPTTEQRVWEREMDEWLESENTTPFVRERLVLSAEEVARLKAQFAGLKDTVMSSIDASSIRLIRVSP